MYHDSLWGIIEASVAEPPIDPEVNLKAVALASLLILTIASSLAARHSTDAANARTGIERVTVDDNGSQANAQSLDVAVSRTGRYVAFGSRASNLVANDTNAAWDVFIRDRQLGTTERVSVDSFGREGNANSFSPAISDDGRFVAFVSAATNLVANDANGVWDVFLHDRLTGATERISVSRFGGDANGVSAHVPILSADGRFVAFDSWASNLVDDDTNAWVDVFVRDRLLGTTERIGSRAPGLGPTAVYAMSADGRFVVLGGSVLANNSVLSVVYVHDRRLRTTEQVSVDETGRAPNGDSFGNGISGDGRFVSYYSTASDLVPGDTNGAGDVFVYDRHKRRTERVSVDSQGNQGNGTSQWGPISRDGRFVVFWSNASNLVVGDVAVAGLFGTDVFIHDRMTNRTRRVSVGLNDTAPNGPSGGPAFSGDGRSVAFESTATNLVMDDTNGQPDIFIRDVLPAANW